MNSTFKVVFNKARGALMVVNEVTSSVQGKGTKTVVAAAVAAMIAGVSGSAMATETDTEIKATDTALKATFTKAEKQDDVASSLIGTSGDKLVLKNVTNKGMYAAGSLDLTASSKDNVVTLKNGSVSNFSGKVTSADHFGAVVTATTGTLKIDNVTFENNKFDEVKTGEQKHNGARGIIRAAGANLEVAKSTFAGNEAVLGGAINVWSNGENTVKITDSTFTGNATKSHGGAVYITGSKVKTTIADSTFSKNTSGKQGGALQLAGAGETTITNTTFSENAAGTFGGAINATNTQVVAKNVNFEGNKAVGDDGHGGALFLNGNTASYTQAGGKFVGNSAKKNGGAIRVQDGADLALTNVVFDGNTAANGGAVDTFNAGDVKFTDTTFTNNQAGGWGGALRINGNNVTIAVNEGKSLVYEGNKAGTNAEEAAVKKYEKQGDFMYLSNASDKATFALAGDLTIKDSIVSNHGTIEKTGKGTLTTADMTGFVGNLNVKEGKMVIEGGIAEYDIAAQGAVNGANSGAAELDATTVTVGQAAVTEGDAKPAVKAELAMGAVQANHAINFVVNQGSTLTMQSLTVGTKEYAQRTEAKADPAKVTYVGAVEIKGDATVTEGVTVAAGTADKAAALTQTSGNLTAKSLTVAAAVKGEKDAVTAKAGTFSQEADGTLTVDTLTNGGTMTVAGTVVTKADSVNSGEIKGNQSQTGSLTIAGGTFSNDGKMTFNKITVEDGATLKTGANAVFVKDVTNNGTIYLADAEFGDKVMFTEADYTQGTTGAITFNGDRLMSAALKDKVHTIAFDDAKVASYEGLETLPLVTAMYEGKAQNGASTSAKFNNWLMSSGNGLDREEVIAIGNDAAKLGATSAVASVTMDAISAFNDSVAARTNVLAQRAEGVTVWADVMGGHYEAKELMDGQGYKSDVYGGVLGVDSVVSGYTLGAAFTVATADTDSTNTLAVSSTDSDFVGFSVYGAKAFGQFNLAADLGYMKGSNDVSVNAYNIGDFSADTDAFTLGLRGDVLVDAGSFKVVPHAGLRFTHLTTDDFESAYTTKIDSMNIFQMPVGVTVTGNVEAAGWNVAPLLDLSVVPAFGDTDADMTLGINGVAATSALSTQVIDSNLFQMKLGVSAQKDAFTFGLNYKLGAGSANRVNNTFNATVGYAF